MWCFSSGTRCDRERTTLGQHKRVGAIRTHGKTYEVGILPVEEHGVSHGPRQLSTNEPSEMDVEQTGSCFQLSSPKKCARFRHERKKKVSAYFPSATTQSIFARFPPLAPNRLVLMFLQPSDGCVGIPDSNVHHA